MTIFTPISRSHELLEFESLCHFGILDYTNCTYYVIYSEISVVRRSFSVPLFFIFAFGFYECIQICPTHMAVLVQFQCVPCIEPCNRVKRTRFKSEIELYNANAHTQNIAHDVSVLMTSHFLQYCKETSDPFFHTNACPHSPTHSHTTVTAAGLRLATGWSRISSTRTVWDTKRDAHKNQSQSDAVKHSENFLALKTQLISNQK